MSVIVISEQMLADAICKAQTFRTAGFPTDENMMCEVLGRMNRKDALQNTNEVGDFFFRLFKWNVYSYQLRYKDSLVREKVGDQEINDWFERSMTLQPKKISILQFESHIRFLLYNIENYEFPDDCQFKKEMDEDVKLLGEILESLDRGIIRALQEKEGVNWCY